MTARLMLCLLLAAAAAAGEARVAFFNQKVSARTVALNQPVHLEFTTIPRQVEGVNIEASVTDAIALGAGPRWRMVGKPVVQIDERTKTLRVSVTLLPRSIGEAVLPAIPVGWLSGDQLAEFGSVKVDPQIIIGNENRPLPTELDTVAGFTWGSKLSDVQDRLPPGTTSGDAERTIAKPQAGLELVFRRGELVEATIDAAELTLDTARASFIDRWGTPQIEENGTITWVLGWTRITAGPIAEGKGVRLQLAREDLVARLTRNKISDGVFRILEGPKKAEPPKAPELPKVPEPPRPATPPPQK